MLETATSERETGQKRLEQTTGRSVGDGKMRLVSLDGAVQRRKKAPPPNMRESPIKSAPCTIRREAGKKEN